MSRSPDSESDASCNGQTPLPSSTTSMSEDGASVLLLRAAKKGPPYLPFPIVIPSVNKALECSRSPSSSQQDLDMKSCPSSSAAAAATDSKQLKFGIERILAEDVRPAKRRHSHHHQDAALMAPCSECVSSLLRCCRLNAPGCDSPQNFCTPYPPGGYYTTLHTPRPVRPYTNMLPSEMSPSERGPASTNKRKRSWSRAVFSNLQRKGLEKRFQLQKYITKPDRRQLAATLGLTDAQVKVWFQNRRMKWRHSKETKLQQSESRSAKEEQGGPDSSTQEPEIDIQTVDN